MSSSGTNKRTRPRRAPRGTLSQETIVSAAIAVIAADGPAGLTMRRLADDLGVRPMSLYTHFRDKDAILRAVADEQFRHFQLPENAPSDIELLRDIMRAYYRLLIEHPVLLRLDAAIEGMTPAQARFAEAIHGCLHRLGIGPHTAVGLVATLVRYVVGAAFVYPTRHVWDDDPDHWTHVRQRWASMPADDFPTMHAVAADYPSYSQQDVFEFGLQTVLDGIVARIRSEG